ncbi:MAG: iron transporter FeoB [Syntrophomonadaceae bacterium]|nr:iron transporter FeoB [Syntrophomonadaceae bacterium]
MPIELRDLRAKFNINKCDKTKIIALAGNPNTGKSTVFNALTGLRQHTGNWPGKTVLQSTGQFSIRNKEYLLVDLPGIYSLSPHSLDELVARDFICFAKPDVTVIVMDASSLARNLKLALQIMEITSSVIICLNLIDEAKRKKIKIDVRRLSEELGVPVIPTIARTGKGIKELKNELYKIADEERVLKPYLVNYDADIEAQINSIIKKIDVNLVTSLINPRWLALKSLDNDLSIKEGIKYYLNIDSGVY